MSKKIYFHVPDGKRAKEHSWCALHKTTTKKKYSDKTFVTFFVCVMNIQQVIDGYENENL